MNRTILVVLMLLLPVASLPGQPAQVPEQHTALEIDYAKVEWSTLPGRDTRVKCSMLRVDEVSGATQMLWRLPANATSPCHWHTANESNMVVQGSVVMRHMGTTGAQLGVGGFSYVAKRMRHQLTTGPTETIVFSSLDGRFDFNPVDDSQCAAAK